MDGGNNSQERDREASIMSVMIIIPTYNEKENIDRLIRMILGMETGVRILVVDDNSPDGTGEIADRLSEEFDEVGVLHRESKLGLGSAYIEGFSHALDAGMDAIMEMDADFSHDPRYIPMFLSSIKEHDLVIGSRYVPGGGIQNWSIYRELLSLGANVYARVLTGMQIKDATGGYRCWRREALEAVDFSRIEANGYAFQVELAYVVWRLGFDILELPIIFTDRRVGKSKMNYKIMWEGVTVVPRLKRKYKDLKPITEETD